jgi:hypothetical protein
MLPEGATIKEGDEVARKYGWNNSQWALNKVKRVTPLGTIVLDNGDRYSSDGCKLGKRFDRWSQAYQELFLVTDAIRQSAKGEAQG